MSDSQVSGQNPEWYKAIVEGTTTCPLCGGVYASTLGLIQHLRGTHKKELSNDARRYFNALYTNLMLKLHSGTPVQVQQPQTVEESTPEQANTNIRSRVGGSSMVETSEDNIGETLDVSDELRKIIYEVLGKKASKVDAVIRQFSYRDPDDLDSLKDILELAGYPVSARQLILKNYALYRGIDEDKVPNTQEEDAQDRLKKEKEEQELSPTEMVKKIQSDAIKNARETLEMLQLARQIKQMGMDPTVFGLPDVEVQTKKQETQKKKYEFPPESGIFVEMTDDEYIEAIKRYRNKTSKETEDEDVQEYEFPPNSGIKVKMSSRQYTDAILKWMTTQQKTEQTTMVEWIDPETNIKVRMPPEEYWKYRNLNTSNKTVEEYKKIIEDLSKKLEAKDKEELYGAINSSFQKVKELEEKLKNAEKYSYPTSIVETTNKLKQVAEDLGFRAGTDPEAQALLKKLDGEIQLLTKSVELIGKRMDRTAENVNEVVKTISPVIQTELRDRLARNRMQVPYTEVPPNENDYQMINQQLQNAQQMNQQQEVQPPPVVNKDVVETPQPAPQVKYKTANFIVKGGV